MAERPSTSSRRIARPVTARTRREGGLELPVDIPSRLTKKNAPKFQEKVFHAHLPEMIGQWYASFIEKLRSGDSKALALGADILNLTHKQGGVNITNNLLANATGGQTAVAAGPLALPPGVNGFDYVVRQLGKQRQQQALQAAAAPVGRQLSAPAEILDAEEVAAEPDVFSIEDLLPDA